MQTKIMLTVEHDKPLPDLVDLVAGRVWTIDGVRSAEASQMAPQSMNRHEHHLLSILDGSTIKNLNIYHPLLLSA